MEVEADRLKEIKVFVSQPRDGGPPGSTHFSFALAEQDGETATKATEFFAPGEMTMRFFRLDDDHPLHRLAHAGDRLRSSSARSSPSTW